LLTFLLNYMKVIDQLCSQMLNSRNEKKQAASQYLESPGL